MNSNQQIFSTINKQLPIQCDNPRFLVERMGQDCGPLQFLRELTQNAIEAIKKLDEPTGEVIWDFSKVYFEQRGIHKLSVIDTGIGMTGPEMVKYINKLSSSGSEQSLTGNYGVGAKIAAATRNPAGLVYMSWKNGKGAMVRLYREENGSWGLEQYNRGDGTYDYWAEISDDLKPEQIGNHGTVVILLGNAPDEDTLMPPHDAAKSHRWVSLYLNKRYFEIPAGITIKAREGSGEQKTFLRRITGQKEYLEKYSDQSGTVDLGSYDAHWWILKDGNHIDDHASWVFSNGHVAALHNNELYYMPVKRTRIARLQQFGVIFGYNRVIIYIEPKKDISIITNTARTGLVLGGEEFPWDEVAADFRERMPDAIVDHMEEVSREKGHDHQETIRERLKKISDLFKITRYRYSPGGKSRADLIEDQTLSENCPILTDGADGSSSNTASEPQIRRNTKISAGNIFAAFIKGTKTEASPVTPDMYPNVKWISVESGLRESGDLEDKAARYVSVINTLLINSDFRVFKDMENRWMRQYEGNPAAKDVVTEICHTWFEQTLVETVIGVRALRNSREWSADKVEAALSEEALTASIMPRYHTDRSIGQELRKHFSSWAVTKNAESMA